MQKFVTGQPDNEKKEIKDIIRNARNDFKESLRQLRDKK